MGDNKKTFDDLAMDAKVVIRNDSYEINQSQVKQRPPAPAPITKALATPETPKTPKK